MPPSDPFTTPTQNPGPVVFAKSTVTIEELTGKRRVLELSGAGLPRRGTPWGSVLNTKITFPAGTKRAVAHVLGPQEAPSEWEGMWRTTLLSRSAALFTDEGAPVHITRADILRDAFESLHRSGQLLRVTWNQDDRKIVREGFATEATFSHDRADDIAWKVTFTWTGRGDVEPPPKLRGESLDSAVQAAIAALDNLVGEIELDATAAAASVLGAASTFTLGNLEALADAPSQFMKGVLASAHNAISSLKKLADTVATVATQPAEIASQCVMLAEDTQAQLNDLCDEFTRRVPDSYSTASAQAAQLASLATWSSGVQKAAEEAAAKCYELARAARQKDAIITSKTSGANLTQNDVLAVYVPKMGDSFVTLSKKFYGTPDAGDVIAIANGYPAYAVTPTPGLVLVIPRRTIASFARQKF